MNGLLRSSSALYARVLFLYPRDLREDFGTEMTLAFADDLEAAWIKGGVAGVLRGWWSVLYELLTVALPGQQSNRYVVVPALSFLMVALSEGTLVGISIHHAALADPARTLASQVMPVLLMSLLAAWVAFIATWFCSQCSMTRLRLD